MHYNIHAHLCVREISGSDKIIPIYFAKNKADQEMNINLLVTYFLPYICYRHTNHSDVQHEKYSTTI